MGGRSIPDECAHGRDLEYEECAECEARELGAAGEALAVACREKDARIAELERQVVGLSAETVKGVRSALAVVTTLEHDGSKRVALKEAQADFDRCYPEAPNVR